MKTEQGQYLINPSHRRPINANSLRPGHLLDHYVDGLCVVVQNSNRDKLIEVLWKSGMCSVCGHDYVANNCYYRGRAKKRKWHKYLPAFLRNRVSPYSF
jgi:hypothetical protein